MAREEKSQSVVVESSRYRRSENGVHHGGLFVRVRPIQIIDDMYNSRMDANLYWTKRLICLARNSN
jgi:hypothetical protein